MFAADITEPELAALQARTAYQLAQEMSPGSRRLAELLLGDTQRQLALRERGTPEVAAIAGPSPVVELEGQPPTGVLSEEQERARPRE